MSISLPKTGKSLKVDQANSRAVILVAIAAAIVVFCAFSAKAMLAQGAYQRRVVNAKHDTVSQLKENIQAAESLSKQYDVFESANPNAIGGKSDVADNAVPPDGKNSRIVLDALPTAYDFPALMSSLSKLLTMNGMSAASIGGADQGPSAANEPATNPEPVSIAQIPLSGTSSYDGIQALIRDLERSIRPYDVLNLQLSGNNSEMSLTLNMNTWYQPAKIIKLESKEVQ